MNLSVYALPDLYIQKHKINALSEIMDIVSEKTGISKDHIKGPKRKIEYIIPRFLFFYVARSNSSTSLSLIGQHAGGRDHTTVMHGIKTIKGIIETEEQVNLMYITISAEVRKIITSKIEDLVA